MRSDSELFLKKAIEESKKQKEYEIDIDLNDCLDIPGIGQNIGDILKDLEYNDCISSLYANNIDGTVRLTLTLDGINYFDKKKGDQSISQNIGNTFNNYTIIQGNNNEVNNNNIVEQGFDYKAAKEIVNKIKECDKYFNVEFDDNAERVRDILSESEKLIDAQENPSRIVKLLGELKQIAYGVTGSMIAQMIMNYLQNF